MALINRLSIKPVGQSWLHLPPFNIEFGARPRLSTETIDIPLGQTEHIGHVHGWDINLSAQIREDDIPAGHAFEDALGDAVSYGDGRLREFDLCRWLDTDGVASRIYRRCKIAAWPAFEGKREEIRRFEMRIVGQNRGYYQTGSDGSTPGISPYEDFLVNAEAGEAETMGSKQYATPAFYLGGMVQVTDAANEEAWQVRGIVPGTSGNAMLLKRVEVVGCDFADPNAASTTTLRCSTTDYASAGDGIDLTLGSGVTRGSATGSVAMTAGASYYAYLTAAGGGQEGMNIILHFEEA